MAGSDSPKIYAGMLKRELLEVADSLGLRGVKKLRKNELLEQIQEALKRPKGAKKKADSTSRAGVKTAAPAVAAASSERPKASSSKKKKAADKKPKAAKTPAKAPKSKSTKTKKATTAAQKAQAAKSTASTERQGDQPVASTELSEQSRVTASKYRTIGIPFPAEDLRQVDSYLPWLPDGYGEDRIVLLPRDPQWLYAYWDIRIETKDGARAQGGSRLSLRLFEQHDGELHPMLEQWVDELARSWYLRVPSPGQTYVAEIGYRSDDGSWIQMLRSNSASVPPAGPSSIVADQFITVNIDDPLPGSGNGAPKLEDFDPTAASPSVDLSGDFPTHEGAYEASVGRREFVSGSVPGVAPGVIPGAPGFASPQAGPPWGGSQLVQQQPEEEGEEAGRDFWLIADAELIVFGKTEPTATVTLSGQKIRLREDGTFSVRMAFPDGKIEIPIHAVAEDGEQNRSITMDFSRETTRGASDDS